MLPVYSVTNCVDISHKGQNNHPRKVRTIHHQNNAYHNCTILTHFINLEFTHIYVNTIVNYVQKYIQLFFIHRVPL